MQYSGHFHQDMLSKIVVIPPMQFPYFKTLSSNHFHHKLHSSTVSIITTSYFLDGRRKEMVSRLEKEAKIVVSNINNFSTDQDAADIYGNASILLNMHQRVEFNTAEEFRILPALLRGAVVISEDVPLRETIPYHRYIIWYSGPQDVVEVVSKVYHNYAYYFNRIHGPTSGLMELLQEMEEDSYNALLQVLLNTANKLNKQH
jgi:hypothetical protein